MALEIEIQFTDTLRARNRALTIVNRNLRRREAELIAQRDETVEALLEAPNGDEATEALREIWEKSDVLRKNYSPDDYSIIVDFAVKAINSLTRMQSQSETTST